MVDNPGVSTEVAPAPEDQAPKTALIVYGLYLASLIVGITSLIGVIVAYVYRKDAADWLQTHYRFQIRTFWIGVLYSLVGVILAMVFIGWFILVFAAVWLIVRCVIGIKRLGEQKPIANPASWLFGN